MNRNPSVDWPLAFHDLMKIVMQMQAALLRAEVILVDEGYVYEKGRALGDISEALTATGLPDEESRDKKREELGI